MRQTLEVLRAAVAQHPRYVLAYSGGTDSTVLLDLVARFATVPPVALIHVRTGLEPDETLVHVTATADRYHLPLVVARPAERPEDLWRRRGLYPIAGKSSGRTWTSSHAGYGFKADCSSCCQASKIDPGRKATREAGATLQLVGLRGNADSASRGLHAERRGALYEVDGLAIAAPLTGWTDLRVASYVRRHRLALTPVTLAGGEAGCLPCAGGAQFTTSSLRRARLYSPERLREILEETGLGEALLAVRFGRPLPAVRRALALLDSAPPHVFDFIRATPMPGYEK